MNNSTGDTFNLICIFLNFFRRTFFLCLLKNNIDRFRVSNCDFFKDRLDKCSAFDNVGDQDNNPAFRVFIFQKDNIFLGVGWFLPSENSSYFRIDNFILSYFDAFLDNFFGNLFFRKTFRFNEASFIMISELSIFFLGKIVKSNQSIWVIFLIVDNNSNGVVFFSGIDCHILKFQIIFLKFNLNRNVFSQLIAGCFQEFENLNCNIVSACNCLNVSGFYSFQAEDIAPFLTLLFVVISFADTTEHFLWTIDCHFEVHEVLVKSVAFMTNLQSFSSENWVLSEDGFLDSSPWEWRSESKSLNKFFRIIGSISFLRPIHIISRFLISNIAELLSFLLLQEVHQDKTIINFEDDSDLFVFAVAVE